MKRAIAMKCSQEQWDAIKGKLVGMEMYAYSSLEIFPYLVNNANGEFNIINSLTSSCKSDYNREVHETWNEQIFLKACGIETEKIFKAGELEFINHDGEWQKTAGEYRVKIKPDHSKEIAE